MAKNRTVLIVDDELLVRIGIRHSIDWEQYHLKITGEASDGMEALRLLHQTWPDVMILDINMPNMDGLEVLQKIHEEKCKVKVIVLTCYEELEYAKKALKLGACDYVLKSSIGENGLKNALEELVFEEENAAENSGDFLQSQEDILTCIIEGHPSSAKMLAIKEDHLFCIGIRILQMKEVEKRYLNKKENYFHVSFRSIAMQVLAGQKEYVFLQFQPDLALIYMSFSSLHSVQECMIKVRQITERLVWALSQYMAVQVRVGVSQVHYHFTDIQKAYQEACEAIQYGILKPGKNIFYYESGYKDQSENIYPSKKREIKALLYSQKYEEALKKIKDTFFQLSWEERRMLPETVEFLKEIVSLIESTEDCQEQLAASLDTIETFDDIKQIVTRQLEAYIVKNENFLIQKVENYLKEHYRKAIALADIAGYMGLSESYVSRLFNKETGMNISTYVNQLRIAKAKELLKNTNMKIYEISEAVGYSSTTVFHITFKKMTGMTPADYRKASG